MTIIELDSTYSTNSYAAKLNPKPGMPFIVKAGFQEMGRGQGDHIWESEANKNLLFSIVFDPHNVPIEKNFFISKYISLCLLELVHKFESSALIKWPNDILIGEKKLAGILIENSIYGTIMKQSIAGVGLNINENFGNKNLNAISLKEITGIDYNVNEVLNEFIQIYESKFYLLEEKRFQEINSFYFKNLFHWEQSALFKDHKSSFKASIIDVLDDGQIVLKMESGDFRKYSFGEIEYLLAE